MRLLMGVMHNHMDLILKNYNMIYLKIYLLISFICAIGAVADFYRHQRKFYFWLSLMWFVVFLFIWPYGVYKAIKKRKSIDD